MKLNTKFSLLAATLLVSTVAQAADKTFINCVSRSPTGFSPALVAGFASVILPFIYWKLPKDKEIYRTVIYCGLGITAIGML
ncbi:hypothetical protein KZ327_09740, partial [Glaesserella parasuis]|nr:hypothetical protein [Glaesserella parasuis]